jgi:SAM-dependent methyltransferase
MASIRAAGDEMTARQTSLGTDELTLREIGKRAFQEGSNVAQTLREHLGIDRNTPEIIEIAYDLQAGTYVEEVERRPDFVRDYSAQLAQHLEPHLRAGDVLLDAGSGELTTLSHLVSALRVPLATVYATDISEPRLKAGRAYAGKHMKPVDLRIIKAELSAIPLPDKSVDVVTTNHAIEPNGGREEEILGELKRIARRKLVLFEPYYEIASSEGQSRMAGHGYIRGLQADSITPLELVANPLNPTACFVIDCRP